MQDKELNEILENEEIEEKIVESEIDEVAINQSIDKELNKNNKFCTSCGAKIDVNINFCTNCGIKLNSNVVAEGQFLEVKKTVKVKSIAGIKLAAIGLAVGLILIIVGAVGGLVAALKASDISVSYILLCACSFYAVCFTGTFGLIGLIRSIKDRQTPGIILGILSMGTTFIAFLELIIGLIIVFINT